MRRRGPKPLPAGEKREHCVSVRLNDAELALVDAQRGHRQRGEWLRMAAIDQLPPTIPALNREAWAALSKSAGNLATVGNAMRKGAYVEAEQLREVVATFRAALIGAGATTGDDDEGDA